MCDTQHAGPDSVHLGRSAVNHVGYPAGEIQLDHLGESKEGRVGDWARQRRREPNHRLNVIPKSPAAERDHPQALEHGDGIGEPQHGPQHEPEGTGSATDIVSVRRSSVHGGVSARIDTGEPHSPSSCGPSRLEARRRTRTLQQQTTELTPDTLRGEVRGVQRLAECDQFGRDRKPEHAGEASHPPHPQYIVPKGRIVHRTEDALSGICEAARRVLQLSGQRVPRHRVDCQITPPRRLGQAEVWITRDLPSGAPVAARTRERDIELDATGPQLENAKTSPDSDHRTESTEDRLQRRRFDTVNLKVQIVVRAPQHGITHSAANQPGSAVRVRDGASKRRDHCRDHDVEVAPHDHGL